jgi:transcriptional regulator with XRE-family HTH domain
MDGRPPTLAGERLRWLRAGLRLTQEELAGRAGVHKKTIWGIEERRSRPRPRTVRRLAAVLVAHGARPHRSRAPDDRVGRSIDVYLEFRAGLRAVLARVDLAAFRAFLREAGRAHWDPELATLAVWPAPRLRPLMHRLILADRRLAAAHGASRAWLRRHGVEPPPAGRGYGWPNARAVELRRSA